MQETKGKRAAQLEAELEECRTRLADLEAALAQASQDEAAPPLGAHGTGVAWPRVERDCTGLLASTADAVLATDLDGMITLFNLGAEALFDWPRDEALGSPISRLCPDDLKEEQLELQRKARELGSLPGIETERLTAAGVRIPVEMTLTLHRDAAGQPIGGSAIFRDITERKRVEEALRQSEARFRDLAEMLPEVIFETDPELRITYTNRCGYRLFGYAPGDMEQGLNGLELIVREDRDRARKNLERRFAGTHAGLDEYEALHKDGSTFPILFSMSPTLEQGEVVGFRGVIVDITQRRQADVELRRTGEKYRNLYINTPVMLQSVDADGKLLSVSRQWLETLGYAEAEVIGRAPSEFLTEASRRYAEDAVSPEFFANGRCHEIPYRFVKKNGEPIDVLLSAVDERDESGKITGSLAVIVDVTKRKRAEAALRESEERLQTVFSASVDFLMLLDRDHNILMVNRAAPGVTQADVIGTPLYSHAAPGDDARVKGELDKVVRHGESRQYDTTFPHPEGGTVFFSSVATPVIVAGMVTGSVVTSRDVTDKLRLEEERRQLEEQYQHSQKMEAIGRLAGGVAHDFNNVLCAIGGNAELALQDLPSCHPARESMDEIAQATERASDLTRQLLAFSRKQVIAPKVVNLSQLVESLHSMLVRLIGEDIILRTVPHERLGRVRVDPGQLEQVVLNLAVNARDAMPDGGELVIQFANVFLDDAQGDRQAGTKPGAHVMLEVQDTGSGMSEEVREKIFEPFFTTKQLGQGTGLGLATVFGIVKQNGGRIEVSSEPGEGSAFRIYFPSVLARADELTPSELSDSVGGDETVLVVEDERIVRILAVKLLERRGYNVLSAASGSDALTQAESYDNAIDLLLTDVVMPHMDGRELATKLVAQRPRLKVLYTSGYPQDVIAHRGVLDEGVEFLAKPYSQDTLAVRVREVLDADAK